MQVGTSEAEPIWTEFLRKRTQHGLRGIKGAVTRLSFGNLAALSRALYEERADA